MGFILLPCFTILIQNFMMLMFINGLWRHGIILVFANLDQNQESVLPYYDAHNEVHEEDHSHEDGFCDCNSQGPWQPLFKPSQVLPDDTSDHGSAHSGENSIDGSSIGHTYTLPHDLHPSVYSGDRKAKKQNHMIHLHLIPHIYVPVLHPVSHPSYPVRTDQNREEQSSQEAHTYDHYSGENNSVEHDSDVHNDHGREHEPYLDEHLSYNHHHDTVNENVEPDVIHHNIPNHFNVHVPDGSQESEELAHNTLPSANLHYRPYASETHVPHQYEVHEEPNRDPYFGNYATGSNVKTKVLPPSKNSNFDFAKMVAKQKYMDRGQLNKKYLNIPVGMRKLRVMRPPPLGQKETWMTNLQRMETRMFPKSIFQFKSYPKNSLFDFKPSYIPKIQSIKHIPLMQSVPSKTLKSNSPIVFYPLNTMTKREDKTLKTKN